MLYSLRFAIINLMVTAVQWSELKTNIAENLADQSKFDLTSK